MRISNSMKRWIAVAVPLLAVLTVGPALLAQQAKKNAAKGPYISPSEAIRQGAVELWKAETAKGRVGRYLADAQRKKDIIRINCVQEKLVRLNTVVEMARQTLQRLRAEAPKDESGDSSRLLFEKISLLRERSEALRRDAEACSGEEMSYTGNTKVFFKTDPNIPIEDPSDPGPMFIPQETGGFDRPPEVSPYI
ncbi:MAG: hypothetical protein J7M25_18935 [Deltaproteobacteria bacterium]|nr:hypothetical protein [Deltaproteobacteria bacterium]